MKNASAPAITMHDFFELPAVKEAQDIQKRHPHGSPEHRAAFDKIKGIAATYGAESFFPEYE